MKLGRCEWRDGGRSRISKLVLKSNWIMGNVEIFKRMNLIGVVRCIIRCKSVVGQFLYIYQVIVVLISCTKGLRSYP